MFKNIPYSINTRSFENISLHYRLKVIEIPNSLELLDSQNIIIH